MSENRSSVVVLALLIFVGLWAIGPLLENSSGSATDRTRSRSFDLPHRSSVEASTYAESARALRVPGDVREGCRDAACILAA